MTKVKMTLVCSMIALLTALCLTPTSSFAQSHSQTISSAVVEGYTAEQEPPPDDGAATEEPTDEELAGRRKGRPGRGLLQ